MAIEEVQLASCFPLASQVVNEQSLNLYENECTRRSVSVSEIIHLLLNDKGIWLIVHNN